MPTESRASHAGPLRYPETRRDDVVDILHGQPVADPYRWLEDPDTPETRAWIEAQNRLTSGFLSGIPAREAILGRLKALWNYERYGVPFQAAGKYFYFKNDGLQNQSVLYMAEGLDATPRTLLDPNALSPDGTVAVAGLEISESGRYLAYGLSQAGSDWVEWRVRDLDSGRDLPDLLRNIKFSGVSWTHDDAGFFYSRFDVPAGGRGEDVNQYQKLYYHRLGDSQEKDRLVYERPDRKEWGFDGRVTEDGRYLIITVWQGTDTRKLVFWQDLQDPAGLVHPLIEEFFAGFGFIGNDGPVLWFRTDCDAPRGRVVAVDLRAPDRGHWSEVIQESGDTLEDVNLVNDHFLAAYLRDAHSRVEAFDLHGRRVRELSLPGLGSAYGFGGKRRDRETFYCYQSFTAPPVIYRLDLAVWNSEVFRAPRLDFDSGRYETRQVFCNAGDGTRLPVFITCRKDLRPDGNNPTYLYGYGGFNISLTPSFSVPNLVWMEMGGVFAVAIIRGGGEYGEEWHRAGIRRHKEKGFGDFLSAAQWLIKSGYTRREKLAVGGGSNGGLLVGACLVRGPDLFAAALPAVGVFDMLRFHKFTIGWAWTADYGSPDNPEDFRVLKAYSPLHNVRPAAYPAALITTADHDDRVVPAHSFKFAAALQHAQQGPAPILIRIETRAGHGAGKPLSKTLEEIADRWAFLSRVLDMPEIF